MAQTTYENPGRPEMTMSDLRFTMPDDSERRVAVRHLLNAGYAGRDTQKVQQHVDELAALGVPAPARTPTLYPLPALLASQAPAVEVPHAHTSGEAEWALVVGDDTEDLMITAACDHTDRDLEAHGVAWSKQAGPDILGDRAWYLADVADELDRFALRAFVSHDPAETETQIQDGLLAELLPPSSWVERLEAASLLRPGTVLLSGTIPMLPGVDQFGDAWRVELVDPRGHASSLAYRVEPLPEPWQ
ncbi:MAG: DUF2848 domain-containing protein [Nocardioidaceae bacterium]